MLGCVQNHGIDNLFFLVYFGHYGYYHWDPTIFVFSPKEYDRTKPAGIWCYLDMVIAHLKVKGHGKLKTLDCQWHVLNIWNLYRFILIRLFNYLKYVSNWIVLFFLDRMKRGDPHFELLQ